MAMRQRGDDYGLGREGRRVHGLQEGFTHGGGEAVLALIGDRLVATVVGAVSYTHLTLPTIYSV